MLVGKTEKLPLGLMNWLILLLKEKLSPTERTTLNLKLRTITASLLKTKRNLDSTKMKLKNSNSSGPNKKLLAKLNKTTMPENLLLDNKKLTFLPSFVITSYPDRVSPKNLS